MKTKNYIQKQFLIFILLFISIFCYHRVI